MSVCHSRQPATRAVEKLHVIPDAIGSSSDASLSNVSIGSSSDLPAVSKFTYLKSQLLPAVSKFTYLKSLL